jgi:hypothetical protein
MERLLLFLFYTWLCRLPLVSHHPVQFSDRRIALTFLWSAICDRPMSWACCRQNWPPGFLAAPPPSASTLSRRLPTWGVQALLHQMLRLLNPPALPFGEHWIDGKALPIGPSTRDPDAQVGRGAGMLAKGYKLHLLWAACGSLEAWRVAPMNVAETKIAATMLQGLQGPGYLVADHLFDWKVLYREVGQRGMQLVVSPAKNASAVPGRRKQDPHRLVGLKLAHCAKGRALLHRRFGIERIFGQLTTQAGGLGPLPNWVRRLPRVRNWVLAKLIWFSFRRALKNKDLHP